MKKIKLTSLQANIIASSKMNSICGGINDRPGGVGVGCDCLCDADVSGQCDTNHSKADHADSSPSGDFGDYLSL